jgi:hypothetical protein
VAGLSDGEATAALRAAATAELSWVLAGRPDGEVVTPLQLDGRPVIAVPYAYAAWARELAALPEMVLTVSDPRLSGQRWKALSLRARPRLVEDPEGTLFCDELLDDELRKHPPSRALADSILLRRENWWFLPRLVLHLDVVQTLPFVERFSRDEGLLVTATRERPQVSGVRVSGWGTTTLAVEPLAVGDPPPDDADQVLLLGHDFTEPDLELWDVTRARGSLSSSTLVLEEVAARPGAGPRPRLMERLRRHRNLRRRCLDGLRGR